MGCISRCSAKWYGFLAVLFINIVSILALLAFCNVTQVLNWACFLEEANFPSLSVRPSAKALRNALN